MQIDPSTRIIESTQRYKGAPKQDQQLSIPLVQTQKELVEFDRSVDLSLSTVFDEERQLSFTFRPVTKFMLIFENAYTGSTTYPPFRDNLYYTNEIQNSASYYPSGNSGPNGLIPNPPTNQTIPWDGFPQYPEFDFQNGTIVVGAPYHFYFGLNNGKTAINRFYKLYVQTVEE